MRMAMPRMVHGVPAISTSKHPGCAKMPRYSIVEKVEQPRCGEQQRSECRGHRPVEQARRLLFDQNRDHHVLGSAEQGRRDEEAECRNENEKNAGADARHGERKIDMDELPQWV